MVRVFNGRTADEAWQEIAYAFTNGEGTALQLSRAGETHEILHSAISIADPTQRWVVSRDPAMNPAFAIAEVIWILTGRNDSAFLNYFNRELPKYAGHGSRYHGAYGHRLRRHFGIDQLERAFLALKERPHSRQVVLQIWDSSRDLPHVDGREVSEDIPCNVLSMLKVQDGKLQWMQILRSNDVYRGLPYNLVQFTTLQEVFAGWLGLKLGEYSQISDSLHAYTDCLGYIRDSRSIPVEANTDSLALPKDQSEELFAELGRHVEFIIDENVSTGQLESRINRSGLSQPFRNMLCVLCAEGARRRNHYPMAALIMADCTNPAYKQLWDRWVLRCSGRSKRAEESKACDNFVNARY